MAATHVSIGGSRPIKIGSTIKHGGREYRINSDGSRTNTKSGVTYGGANPQKRKYNDRKDRWEYPNPEKGLRFFTTRRHSAPRSGSGVGSSRVVTTANGVIPNQAAGNGAGAPALVTKPKSGGTLTFPVERTELHFLDGQFEAAPISDGADFEDRWGEFGGSLAGVGVMLSDLSVSWWSSVNKIHKYHTQNREPTITEKPKSSDFGSPNLVMPQSRPEHYGPKLPTFGGW